MGNLIDGYAFPQKSAPMTRGERGIASITHQGRTFRFRTNPNEFSWGYELNKRVDQTYGGRVIQLLGAKIDDFTVKAEAGAAGWDYINRLAKFLRDVMINQRQSDPATFEYTTRGWKLNAYIVSVPFQDAFEEVLRPFEIQMKVQEDVSGLMSKNSLDYELRSLMDGIGFRRSRYNDPRMQGQEMVDVIGDIQGAIPTDEVGRAIDTVADLAGVNGYSQNQFLPGLPVGGGLGDLVARNIGRQ